ncbi:unnamed protein product [Caenorhabditis bovis]|uniref:Ground-like domain-containing protein n=1 Tax=Caenorhabditis bovis TaxID=2654633 RepID=A0A8S1ER11_9PELO|nr:unnamed protein product [Caenorhabditis bovis]
MRLIAFAILVASTNGFLFPSGGGGGGCGCGCGGGGGGGGGCLPTLGCSVVSFNVPTLKLPPPPTPPCPCPCGGRKKREAGQDPKCTDPELRKIILNGIRSNTKDSRDNIVLSLNEKYQGVRYLVTCLEGENQFSSSASDFCADGTDQQTCIVSKAVDA